MSEQNLYIKPVSVQNAIACAHSHAHDFRYIAGGTDVLVNKFQGNQNTNCLIDLSDLHELKNISVDGSWLKIGSLVTLEELSKDPFIGSHFTALTIAAKSVASPVLRKTATLGGNLLCENRCIFYNQSEWWREAAGYCLKCNGDICIATGGKKNCFSKFVSDTAPVLISLNARLEISDGNGTIEMPLEDIYSGNGINPRKLSPTAIICAIKLPLTQSYLCAFRKLRPRESVDFTSLTTAVSICNNNIRIVLGGVDPMPVIITGSTNDDRAELIRQAAKKPRAINNDYYSRLYRKEMITVFLERSFKELDP